jgi:hypothetical protein
MVDTANTVDFDLFPSGSKYTVFDPDFIPLHHLCERLAHFDTASPCSKVSWTLYTVSVRC